MTTMIVTRYAGRLGVSPEYLYRLKREGKLVLVGDEVDVEETDRKLADSIDWKVELARGPGKVAKALLRLGVVDGGAAPVGGGPNDALLGGLNDAPSSYDPRTSGPLTEIRIRRETADARIAEMRYMQTIGLLVARSDVERELEPLLSTLRESLMAIPDRLGPLVAAETDEHRVHAMIAAEIRAALNELANRAGAEAQGTWERPDAALAPG